MNCKSILFFITLLAFTGLDAQRKLVVVGTTNDLYMEHLVGAKESLSSIGRFYGLTPRQLAAYNGINPQAVLPMNTSIKIPISEDNIVQRAEYETSEPIYHIAGKGENLFRLSQRYFKVPVASLRNWNDLKTDAVKDGQAIIVGYIGGVKWAAINSTATQQGQQGQVFVKPPVLVPVNADPPPLKDPNVMDAVADGSRELKGEMKPMSESDKYFKKSADDKVRKAAEAAAVIVPAPVPLDEFREKLQTPVDNEVKITEADIHYIPKQNDEGYFGAIYAMETEVKQTRSKQTEAGIFKTLSGVTDRKYYILMNDIIPGTIVRVTTANNKSICARVLGSLPEIKGMESLQMRISNAAAAALGIFDAVFPITLTYTP
jgi:LysM repeat protein